MSAAPVPPQPVSAEAASDEAVSDGPTTDGAVPATATATATLPAGPRQVELRLLLNPPPARRAWRLVLARAGAMCTVELQKLRHDRTELYTRAVQPALWLLIFGETFTRIHAIPTGGIPYLDYLAPGIIAQSAMFIAIFYGIMIIWERDSGVLTKLLVTPTPRAALVTGKAFAAGVKSVIQALVVVVIAALLGVALTWNPLRLLGVAVVVVLGSAFFSCLSMTIAGIVLTRDRLMGIGQAITMPLFFGSNALYPVSVMPAWLRAVSKANPLSYEVDALRGLLLGIPAHLGADFGVLAVAAAVGVTTASLLLGRLAK
jgi:ABC-2 type transport system permease protein